MVLNKKQSTVYISITEKDFVAQEKKVCYTKGWKEAEE